MPEPGDFAIKLLQAAVKLFVSAAVDREAPAMVQGEGAAGPSGGPALPIT